MEYDNISTETPNVSLQTSYTPGFMYRHPQAENMDRAAYSALCHQAYTAGMYADPMSMYSPYTGQKYLDEKSYTDERYYPRDGVTGSYTGYMYSGTTGMSYSDSCRVGADSRDTVYRHTDSTQSGVGSCLQYDCAYSGRSRSASRENTYSITPPSQSHSYPPQYSNRSESSPSEVETSNDDLDKRQSGRSCSTGAVKEEKTQEDPTSANSNTSSKEAIPQSVIMRRTGTGNYQAEVNNQINSQSVSERLSSPQEHSHQATDRCQSGGSGSLTPYYGANVDNSSKTGVTDTSPVQNNYNSCLRSACSYETYNQTGTYNGTFQNQKQYPVIPQPGYTSVIVDTQQYHMTNGFVH